MASEAAALPWGNPTSNDPQVVKNVPENMKLEVGTARIEVKWIISPDEENDIASESFVTKVDQDHFQNYSNLLCLAI
jgi:hypothetical protein